MSALARGSGSSLFLYGAGLLLAVVAGAVLAHSERSGGDNGPIVLLGVVLAVAVFGAILAQWRLGAILLAAALPFQSAINFGPVASGMKSLAFLTTVSFALALLLDQNLFQRFMRLWQRPLALMILAFVLWIAASILWASDQSAALSRTITYLGLLGLTIIFGTLERRYLVWAWATLAVSTALSVPLGYILPAPEGSDMVVSGRFGPAGAGPNTYSLIVAIAFFVAYFGLLKRHKVFALAVAPIFLYGIFATGSRTGLIALVVTPLVALIVPRVASRVGWRIVPLYALGAVALVVVALSIPSVDESALERYTTLTNVESADTWNGRLSLWQGAYDVFAAHPIVGVGTGNYAQAAWGYSESVQAHTARKAEQTGGQLSGATHNIFLGVASELGLVGLILLLGILFLASQAAWRLAQESDLGTGIFLGLIVALIGGMTQPWEDEKTVYVLLGSVLALQLHASVRRGLSSDEQDGPN